MDFNQIENFFFGAPRSPTPIIWKILNLNQAWYWKHKIDYILRLFVYRHGISSRTYLSHPNFDVIRSQSTKKSFQQAIKAEFLLVSITIKRLDSKITIRPPNDREFAFVGLIFTLILLQERLPQHLMMKFLLLQCFKGTKNCNKNIKIIVYWCMRMQ